MTLDPRTSYPHTHSYVVKLHRDALRQGRLIGRLQHIYSGEQCQFTTAEELVACLQQGMVLIEAAVQEADERAGPASGTAI
jgi:hypothetical protein